MFNQIPASMLPAGTLVSVQAQDAAGQPRDSGHLVRQDDAAGCRMGGPSDAIRPDGTGKVVAAAIPDQGTWRISELGYCTAWSGIRSGQERCFTVKRSGTAFVIINPDGTEGGRFTEIE